MKAVLRHLTAALALLCLAEITDLAWLSGVRATITTTASKVVAAGNGSTTQWNFSFVGVSTADLIVSVTNSSGITTVLTLNSQYSVTFTPQASNSVWSVGGFVTYPLTGSPLALGNTLTIQRQVPYTQTTPFQNQGQFLPQAVETALDLLTMQVQQLNTLLSGALVAPITDSQPLSPLPAAVARANLALCFDSTGYHPIACAVPASGIISSAMQPVVDAASLAAGRTAFGLSPGPSVGGVPTDFWYPTYFGITGASSDTVARLTRLFVGPAVVASSDITAPNNQPTTPSWLDTLLGNGATSVSQEAALSAIGGLAMTGGSRCSDFRTIFGSSSGGCQGGTFFGVNDDATGSAIACGVCGTGIQYAAAIGQAVNQFDILSAHTTVAIEPGTSGIPAGATISGLFTPGVIPALATQNVSAAWVAAGTAKQFNKGGACLIGALDTSVGAGGAGVCIDMFRGQSVRWRNSTPTTDAEIWGDASGLHIGPDVTIDNFGDIIGANAIYTNYLTNTTHLLMTSTAPTIGACGGGTPAISANNGTAAFRVTVGSATSTCVVNLPTATTGWNCHADDLTTTSTTVFYTKQTASSVSSATLGNFNDVAAAANWPTSDVLAVSCFAL